MGAAIWLHFFYLCQQGYLMFFASRIVLPYTRNPELSVASVDAIKQLVGNIIVVLNCTHKKIFLLNFLKSFVL
jgi:hypothetical protein